MDGTKFYAAVAMVMIVAGPAMAEEGAMGKILVVEGPVKEITARSLVANGQQYPVSRYVRVFQGNERGEETPMHTLVFIGRIDKARLYIMGGKVEKIIVLKNI